MYLVSYIPLFKKACISKDTDFLFLSHTHTLYMHAIYMHMHTYFSLILSCFYFPSPSDTL